MARRLCPSIANSSRKDRRFCRGRSNDRPPTQEKPPVGFFPGVQFRYNSWLALNVLGDRGDWMSGLQRRCVCSGWSWRGAWCGILAFAALLFAAKAGAQQRREREPNSVYAQRRAALAATADGPIILTGLNGREEDSQSYVFAQEENFYYLTGHNEEEGGLILLPPADSKARRDDFPGPREILFLPAKNPGKEKWNGVRMSPSNPGIQARTGFADVREFGQMRATIERLAKVYPNLYTILPFEKELGGYPHEKETADWLKLAAPQATLKDIRGNISDLRLVKSPTEIMLLRQAIELSLDAQLAAMKMMRPGFWEYQVAAKMVEVHAMGGSEAEAYAPIVGAGPNSTVLHYDNLGRKIQD